MNSLDQTTTLQDLKSLLRKFRDERNWSQFHTPKNLSEAITIEAGELLELFLWKSEEELNEAFKNPDFLNKVRHELADILCYCLNFANSMNIDVSVAVQEKVEANQRKYPVEKSKNTAKKYTEL